MNVLAFLLFGLEQRWECLSTQTCLEQSGKGDDGLLCKTFPGKEA